MIGFICKRDEDRILLVVVVGFEFLKIGYCPSLIRCEIASSFVYKQFYHVFAFFRPQLPEDFSYLGQILRVRNLFARVKEKVLHLHEYPSPIFDAAPRVDPRWVF